jgi:hypothetical protein
MRTRTVRASALALTGLLIAACAAAIAGCGSGGRVDTGAREVSAPIYASGAGRLVPAARLTARLPAGWHVTRRPLSGLSAPREVLTLSSFPIRHPNPHTNCTPKTLIDELPSRGAAIWILQNVGRPGHPLDRKGRAFFHPQPRRFSLPRRQFTGQECFGLGWPVDFRDRGQSFYANVYAHPGRLPTAVKRQTLSALDSLRVKSLTPLSLVKPPYLGISCGRVGSIHSAFACDQLSLAVWLKRPAEQVDAAVAGRPLQLNPPLSRHGPWTGELNHAGLGHPPLDLPRRAGTRPSAGAQRLLAPVRIVARSPDGSAAATRRRVQLHRAFHVFTR